MRRYFQKENVRYDLKSGPDPRSFMWLWKYGTGVHDTHIIAVKIPKSDGTIVIQATHPDYTDDQVAALYWELVLGNYEIEPL